jgi:hypothetical protein
MRRFLSTYGLAMTIGAGLPFLVIVLIFLALALFGDPPPEPIW